MNKGMNMLRSSSVAKAIYTHLKHKMSCLGSLVGCKDAYQTLEIQDICNQIS